MSLSSTEEISKVIKDFITKLAHTLNIKISKVMDAYFLISNVEIIDIKESNNEVIGIRVKIPSEHRKDTYHYVTVGFYGFKCTCEACTIKKMICKHVITALSIWYLTMLVKYGKELNLEKIEWLRKYGEIEGTENSLRRDS